jgi:hypothetical protein
MLAISVLPYTISCRGFVLAGFQPQQHVRRHGEMQVVEAMG